VALAAVLVLFLAFAHTSAGLRDVDPGLVDGARLMRATRVQGLVKVIVPSAAWWIFLGLRVGAPYALVGAILGEMIAANRGLGYLIPHAGSEVDTAGVFAVTRGDLRQGRRAGAPRHHPGSGPGSSAGWWLRWPRRSGS